jgi:hypothetical protein
MKVWLDDLRPPHLHGCLGWVWVKDYHECLEALKTGLVEAISLDHDLSLKATLGDWSGELTGYEVLCWMEENEVWPEQVRIHSMNPAGRARMQLVLDKHHGRL